MVFSSLIFLVIFLPCVLLLYFLVPNLKYKNIVLLIFSLIFYAWGEPYYVFLFILYIICTYIIGIIIDKCKNHKKQIFVLSIIFMLSFLFVFKYFDFFIQILNMFLRLQLKPVNIILPIGISFYTFQAISYIVDLYNNKVPVQKNILKLALYISLFPQLIAGPIVRYIDIEKEIDNRKTSIEDIEIGIKIFIIGLFKKVVFANSAAVIADTLFSLSETGILIWIAAIAYTVQIYYDFSGYSDMAIGLGRIFGFHFLDNFNYPYSAISIKDFWSRWHISLTTWFKDYVYIPLGGSRVSTIKNIRNIIIVWSLSGLWHGASWNFVIWGIYYGVLLILEKFVFKKFLDKIPNIIKHVIVLFIVVIGFVIFRINDIQQLIITLQNMFVIKNISIIDIIVSNANIILNFYILILSIPFCFNLKKLNILKSNKFIILINISYLLLYLICIIFLLSETYNPFIYFRF